MKTPSSLACRLSSLGLALLLTACAGTPPPDWQMNAKDAMARASSAYLAGDARVATQEFAFAHDEVARTGRIALMARIELARCALHTASLVFEECSGFEKLRQDAAAPERAYADFLAGQIKPQDVALLPPQQRAAVGASSDAAATALQNIADPLSRLVAAGVLLRTHRATPAVLASAVDTASAQGWRRPLLAWLGAQALLAEQAGNSAEAQRLQRRIALVQGDTASARQP